MATVLYPCVHAPIHPIFDATMQAAGMARMVVDTSTRLDLDDSLGGAEMVLADMAAALAVQEGGDVSVSLVQFVAKNITIVVKLVMLYTGYASGRLLAGLKTSSLFLSMPESWHSITFRAPFSQDA